MCTVKDVFENLKILQEESDFLEESTRKQSNTQTWYDHRKGRITASHFHDVLRYKGKTYPKSIVKAIMQYYNICPTVPSLKWGRDHEDDARKAYIQQVETLHCNLQVGQSQSHQYYDQVQAQLSICKVQYCDFICWTTQGIFIERIFQDENYLSERIPALKNFFCNYILPEILTQKLLEIEPEKRDVSLAEPKPSDVSPDGGLEPNTSNVNSECKKIYCLCRKGEFGRMVGCDNPKCEFEWFHYACVGVKRKPVGAWYCPNCKRRKNQTVLL